MTVSKRKVSPEITRTAMALFKILFEKSVTQDDFDHAIDLFEWNKRVFGILGAWPLQSSYVKFGVWIVYLLIHMIALYNDLFHVFGNFELMILNMSESTWDIMIISKLLVMRFSRSLANLTRAIIDSIDRRSFDSPEEMRIYLNYNRIAKRFFKLWLFMGISASLAYCLKPLVYRLEAGLGNESFPFVLSYRTRYFFEVNDSMTFWLVWVYQTPVMFFSVSQTVAIGYLFSLILHISGQLSVLAFRIHNLHIGTWKDEFSTNIFHDIVIKHRNILRYVSGSVLSKSGTIHKLHDFCPTSRMVEDINGVFGILLLEEVMIMTVLLGLSAYNVIANSNFEDFGEFFAFLFYASGLLCMIYGYCLAGEYLITESTNLFNAYFHCEWYNETSSFKKNLLICMMSASKPNHLTAGGFYNFSLEGFTNILKTSAGYISLLRSMI